MFNNVDLGFYGEYKHPEYKHIVILGCTLVMTCGACPEQYDVYYADPTQDYKDTQIGYLRLRHGSFTAEYPDVCGELVYQACPKGDGTFYDDERYAYLTIAVSHLLEKHKEFKENE